MYSKTLKKELYLVFLIIIFAIFMLYVYQTKKDKNIKNIQQVFVDSKNYDFVNKVIKTYLDKNQYEQAIYVLFKLINKYPKNIYNSYYLFLISGIYYDRQLYPLAKQYYKLLINSYQDLVMKGYPLHYQAYIKLLSLSSNSLDKIQYYNDLLKFYPKYINKISFYYKLGKLYESSEKIDKAFEYYQKVVDYYNKKFPILRSDFAVSYDMDVPQYYYDLRDKINFYNSSRDWIYKDLKVLIRQIRSAIKEGDSRSLINLKAKKGFFFSSFIQESEDFASTQQKNINLLFRTFIRNQNIAINSKPEYFSSAKEVYIKSSGWGYRVNIWYFYFKKVEYIKGVSGWEWKGVIFGEKK